MFFRLYLAALLVLLWANFSLASQEAPSSEATYKPIHCLAPHEVPIFFDDMDVDSLIDAARHQAAYLERQQAGKMIRFADKQYDTGWLLLSVKELLAKLQQRPGKKELDRFLRENYRIYQAGGRPGKGSRKMLVTGYYEPVFSGSLTRTSPSLR